jgi:anti-sigma regulatory factor (Ser/Thr protein kinase)
MQGTGTEIGVEFGAADAIPEEEIRVDIDSEEDIATARQEGRALAAELDFSAGEAILIAAVISELARNVYAKKGEIRLKVINGGAARRGIQVIAGDDRQQIADAVTVMKRRTPPD